MGFGSPSALYKQLALDSSPVCGVCGLLYPDSDHREEHGETKRKKRQPNLGSGRRIELPDASRATGPFRQGLEALDEYISLVHSEESWLEGNVEEGRFKGKRFITQYVDRGIWEEARREEFTEEQWRELCEQHGADPGRGRLLLDASAATAGGVTRAPSAFLTALIAACALAGRPLSGLGAKESSLLPDLIEALHPDPESADMDKLYANAKELREVAEHLAARVRGGVVEGGRRIEEVSREEHWAAWFVRDIEERRASADEQTHERPRKELPGFAGRLTPTDIDRIKRLRLEPPQ